MRRMIKFSCTALALGCTAFLAQAQPRPATTTQMPLHSRPLMGFKFYSKAQIAKSMYRQGPTNSYVVTDQENYDIEYVKRALITNHIEDHMHWLDYVTVLEGEGTLSYGGKLVDPDYTNPSEPHGTKMTGANVIALHSSDYVVVPAGTWHSFSGTRDHTLTYVIFKQRE
jgi:quercetin dioxygenase-like cupin family protein